MSRGRTSTNVSVSCFPRQEAPFRTWSGPRRAGISSGDSFLTRKLDRVRVIGIDTPVRLYEVLEERSNADKTLLEGLAVFHRALELFEDKHWDEAEKAFGEVLAILPEDGPATTFQNRCREYQKKKPLDSWDGVFNLNTK